jgi:hypothetical protein
MSEQDNELLSQYLDGELGAPEVTTLEARLGTEPALQASLNKLQSVDTRVRAAFNTPGADKVPARITHMLEKPTSNVVAFPQRRQAGWGFAIAASLLAASGLLFIDGPQQGVEGDLLADSLLSQELERAPSRSEGWELLADGRQLRPVLSFHSNDGSWCREYMVAEEGQYRRAVACRGTTNWVTEVSSLENPGFSDSSADYRTAGAGDSEQIQQFIEARAEGVPLSAEQEAQLISNNWK